MKNKKRVAIVACVLFSFTALPALLSAKYAHRPATTTQQKQAQHQKFIAGLLKNSEIAGRKSSARTTTELAERLVAQTDYGMDIDTNTYTLVWEIMDSMLYQYSGTRTSYFDYNYMDYNNSYVINGAGVFGFGSYVGFSDHNDLPDMLSDTTTIWQIDPYTFGYGLDETRYSIYDSNNNITDFADYYVSGIGWRYLQTYDANTNISSSLYLMLDTPLWDTTEFRLFSFNSTPLLTKDSTLAYDGMRSWELEEKYVYTYDSYNNLTQASYFGYDTSTALWTEGERYVMTYYGANKLEEITDYSIDTGILQVNAVDSFGWTTGLNYVTFHRQETYNFGVLDYYYDYIKPPTTDSLPDSMYTIFYDPTGAALDTILTIYTYDSYSEPLTATYLAYDSANGFFDSTTQITNYYYEVYEETPAHNNAVPVVTSNPNIKIYPNPASDELNINWPGVTNGTYTTILLINAAGQTVRSEGLPWYAQTETMPMQGLAPGMYWVVVQGKAGNTLCRQQVVKQ